MNQMMMRRWEEVSIDESQLFELRLLIAGGESLYLEFKKKATHPEKILREMIAFANTQGGTILIGVDDDGSISGVKYPEEEWMGVSALLANSKPPIPYHVSLIAIPDHRFIIRLDIAESDRRPHFLVIHDGSPETYVRVRDMSIKASTEMEEIVRRQKKKKDIKFVYGEHEQQLMKYLADQKTITLPQFRELTGLNRFKASRKLILLVLANVLKIEATEKGDLYSRV
ncbi:MAG: ATP-binding protein [Cyclobacteriaceae bacterium]|nr:ATP-binding protein [Cyclobacteriaceae bacterium]